jgi:hypothetical protein
VGGEGGSAVGGVGDGLAPAGTRPSVVLGLVHVGLGIAVNLLAAVQHRRCVAAIDAGTFRDTFRATWALAIAVVLALVGCGMAVYLVAL